MPYADVGAALDQSTVTWEDIKWIREAWKGPIVIKGVHIGDDAKRAVDEGANAIVVSNHGGRQLDGVSATIRVLPEVVAAVGGRTEVLIDGGDPPRQRHREGAVPRRAGRADRPRLRVRPGGRGRARRDARDRDPEDGPHPHDEAARLPVGRGAGSLLRRHPRGLARAGRGAAGGAVTGLGFGL